MFSNYKVYVLLQASSNNLIEVSHIKRLISRGDSFFNTFFYFSQTSHKKQNVIQTHLYTKLRLCNFLHVQLVHIKMEQNTQPNKNLNFFIQHTLRSRDAVQLFVGADFARYTPAHSLSHLRLGGETECFLGFLVFLKCATVIVSDSQKDGNW